MTTANDARLPGQDPAYLTERRHGETAAAYALRITAAYLHDKAVTGMALALAAEQDAGTLARMSQDITAGNLPEPDEGPS